MQTAVIPSPLGLVKINATHKGLTSIALVQEAQESHTIPTLLVPAARQFKEYFAGQRQQFKLPLNPVGTTFQKQVWQALQAIPYGSTTSYLQLAKNLGNPKAIRAVAAANGKNPLWIVVPCHRVIGSNGALVGYAGGLHVKKWLLAHEAPVKQQSLF